MAPEEGYIGALCRLDQVLHKLKDCSAELNEIERIVVELKSNARGSPEASFQPEERPDLLLVAGTLRGMVNTLKTGLEGVPDIQRVNSPGSAEDNMRSKWNRLSLVLDRAATQAEVNKACSSFSTETRVAKRAAVNGPQVCRHICIHHPEMIDPGLWSKLSEDLVGLVFARLPIPQIIELRKCSTAWSSLSETSSFKRSFAEANPNLFGLLGWDNDLETFRTRMFDAKSKEWHGVELTFPLENGYMDAWYACDGGLVCFVPECEDEEDWGPYSVYVCNPLTNSWKALPDLPLGNKEPVLLQMVTDVDANCYRVILVCREKKEQALGVNVYDSKTGLWSTMDSGLAFGSGNTLLGDRLDPLVFDCATKILFNLDSCPPLEDLKVIRYSFLKDRLFVLHEHLVEPNTGHNTSERYVVSEYAWQSSTSELKKLNDYEGTLRGLQIGSYVGRHDMELFTSSGFILSTWDNLDENGSVSQLIRLYDMSADEWRNLPTLVGTPATRNEKLEGVFMCELRWDAIP